MRLSTILVEFWFLSYGSLRYPCLSGRLVFSWGFLFLPVAAGLSLWDLTCLHPWSLCGWNIFPPGMWDSLWFQWVLSLPPCTLFLPGRCWKTPPLFQLGCWFHSRLTAPFFGALRGLYVLQWSYHGRPSNIPFLMIATLDNLTDTCQSQRPSNTICGKYSSLWPAFPFPLWSLHTCWVSQWDSWAVPSHCTGTGASHH